MITLPVVSCDGCGECCRHQVMPPFVRFDGDPEWERLKASRPDLAAGIEAEIARKTREDDWPDDAPCFWFDIDTGRCRHYEDRPQICRDFEVGCEDCIRYRDDAGI